jgi:hypothetical protein
MAKLPLVIQDAALLGPRDVGNRCLLRKNPLRRQPIAPDRPDSDFAAQQE